MKLIILAFASAFLINGTMANAQQPPAGKPATAEAPAQFDCPASGSFGLKLDPADEGGFSASGPGLGNRIAGSYFPFDSASLSGDKKTLFCMYKVGNGHVAFYSKAAPAGKACTAGPKGFSCK